MDIMHRYPDPSGNLPEPPLNNSLVAQELLSPSRSNPTVISLFFFFFFHYRLAAIVCLLRKLQMAMIN